jgi:hypothetical protein
VEKIGERNAYAGANLSQGCQLWIVFSVEDFAEGGFGNAVFVGENLYGGVTAVENAGLYSFADMF